jgi:hypothetical protein
MSPNTRGTNIFILHEITVRIDMKDGFHIIVLDLGKVFSKAINGVSQRNLPPVITADDCLSGKVCYEYG